MEQELIDFLYKLGYVHIQIPNDHLKRIYDLFLSDILFEPMNSIEYGYVGIYYEYKKNYDLMKKNYLIAINLGNVNSMVNLAYYYLECKINRKENQNDELIEKYYIMAVELGNTTAMLHLGVYHDYNRNYPKMEKYYLMAAENGNSYGYLNLGQHHVNNYNNDSAIYYLLKAIYADNTEAMFVLGSLYRNRYSNYDEMKKYILMAIKRNHSKSFSYLARYYQERTMLINLLELYVDYPHMIEESEIVKIIVQLIDSNLYKGNKNEFI